MRIIELDAAKWKTVIDFYNALLPALGAPKWHGESVDALIDSAIWGRINAIDPPYTIRIVRTQNLSKNVRDHIILVKEDLAEARKEFQVRRGKDTEVNFELEP
jgi:RNAse (barnase) inhibitor barstar